MSRSEAETVATVDVKELLATLEESGDEKTRATYARHGAAKSFGASWALLGKLQKRIKQDQALARSLWESGFFEARSLAVMIADPEAMTPAALEAWIKADRCRAVVDSVAKLAARTPAAAKLLAKWTKTKTDPLRQAGYVVLAEMLKTDGTLDDAEAEKFLATIEKEIHGSPNRARHAMNMAVCAIGIYRPALRAAALAAAKRIGTVEVDHGDTACETPDAAAYIAKAAARAKKKGR